MSEALFPDEALAVLRAAVYSADAERAYEAMSGSFWWSDELVREASYACRRRGSWAFRYLLGYRASLIRGEPEVGLRPAWDQLAAECPGWPGFRSERNSPALALELHRAGRRQCVEFLRWERELQGQTPDAEQGVVGDRGPQPS